MKLAEDIPNMFTKSDIISMANRQLAKYNLRHKGWKVEIGEAKTQAGVCFYNMQVIRISLYLANLMSEEELKDTILHEIAHALAGTEAYHGSEWRKWCITVGARPQTTFAIPDGIEYKWDTRCEQHGLLAKRHRRRRLRFCGLCAKEGFWRHIEYRLSGIEEEWHTFI